MAEIQIWNGTSTFTTGSTPFGFYDNDSEFAAEADKVAKFCSVKLGYPLMDVELNSGSFYACFEEAVTTYGNEVYQAIITQNYLSLEGASKTDPINNFVIKPSLNSIIRLSKEYGTEAGVGGTIPKYSGSLTLSPNIQTYDLKNWAQQQGITGSIEIRRIFYEAPPAIMRYFDPYAGTGTGIQSLMEAFDFGSYSPGVNFMLMPASFDILKMQAIEFNDQIRRSAYSFEIVNNMLKIFPIPTMSGSLFFEYYKNQDKQSIIQGEDEVSSTPITNIFNVPFENPTYSDINSVGKQWVYRYAAALAKEMLAYVRGKYQTVPVPGSNTTLNQGDLLTDARAEKAKLLEDLKEILNSTSKSAQLERKSNESKFLNDTLNNIPMTIYIG